MIALSAAAALFNHARPPVSEAEHQTIMLGRYDLPSYVAIATMVGLYCGDPILVRGDEIVIDLNKALDVPPRPDEDCAVPVPPTVIDELESRGWIRLPYGDALPVMTPAGRYWIRRYADKTVGKKFEPLHPTPARIPQTEDAMKYLKITMNRG